jgi:DNA polymerase III delta subunit
MILFLYGPDSFRSKQKLDEIILHYKESKKSGLNLISLDAKELEFSDFYNTFKVSSMFVEKKLVIVKNVFSNKKFQEDFLKALKDIEALPDVVALYESEEVDQRLKLFKTLLKESKCQEFSALSGLALKKWAQQEFEKLGQKINVDALDYLLQCTASDLWRTSSVMQQLTSYKNKAVIKKEDVVAFVKPNITTDIFKTIDSLAQKDKRQALNLIHKHLDDG